MAKPKPMPHKPGVSNGASREKGGKIGKQKSK